jgi:Holliday junction resolvasome RuvABC endonuclease subunit
MIVLGVDPGMKNTGLAALELHRGRQPIYLGSATIVDLSTGRTYDGIADFAEQYHVQEIALLVFETSLRNVNGRPILMKSSSLTQRTIGAVEIFAHLSGLPIYHYDETEVKEGCAGSKTASKDQVAAYVRATLSWKTKPIGMSTHEFDAVAACLYHELAVAMMRRW